MKAKADFNRSKHDVTPESILGSARSITLKPVLQKSSPRIRVKGATRVRCSTAAPHSPLQLDNRSCMEGTSLPQGRRVDRVTTAPAARCGLPRGAGRAAGAAWRPAGNNAAPRSAAAASQRRGARGSRGPSATREAPDETPVPGERERSAVPRGEANAEFICATDVLSKRTCKTCAVVSSSGAKEPARAISENIELTRRGKELENDLLNAAPKKTAWQPVPPVGSEAARQPRARDCVCEKGSRAKALRTAPP